VTSLLFDVNPIDPVTFAAVSIGLLAAATVASCARAARRDD
jgi:hypothetical protein